MLSCPICRQRLSPSAKHPYAPICSERCRKEALRRSGVSDSEQAPSPGQGEQAQFEQFNATHLFCPTCRHSMPTREKLLLTLPTGDLYAYHCAECGAEVGTRTEKQ